MFLILHWKNTKDLSWLSLFLQPFHVLVVIILDQSSSTIHFWLNSSLLWESVLSNCRMLSSIPGLYPLDVKQWSLPPSDCNPKPQALPSVPRHKIAPGWELLLQKIHCLISSLKMGYIAWSSASLSSQDMSSTQHSFIQKFLMKLSMCQAPSHSLWIQQRRGC